MDFLKKAASDFQASQGQSSQPQEHQQQQHQQQPPAEGSNQGGEHKEGGFNIGGFNLGNIGDKLHGVAGGGPESEKNEDALDKGVDWVQEHVLKQGPQDNESAAEQMKDEQISDFIRKQYKSTTGKDFPVQDKERLGL